MKRFLLIVALNAVIFSASPQCLGKPHPFAVQDISAICSVLDTKYINVYASACTNFCSRNAITTRDSYGRPYIVYDPIWFEEIYLRLGRAANISILAHEVGHVITPQNYNTSYQGMWQNELDADFVSGIAMRRLGYSLDEALEAMRYITKSSESSSTHPPLDQRLNAIQNGWYRD